MDAIIENSNHVHEKMMLKQHCTVSDLPTCLAIDIANIEASFNLDACACLCSYFMCPYLHICTLNNNHLISFRNSCSLDTSCRRSDTLFLEYNTDVNAR